MRGVMAASTSAGSSCQPLSALVGMSTGAPPANTMPGTYATYDGSWRSTSSPGSTTAPMATASASEAPTVTSISVTGS